ncbi:hypothetical protein CHX27_00875 [Flavobacterium aurantiibacter]|uniref:Uncharacterized protein n=1 Tax=Flavobacterium aurantiibacter TaxID=2023067 RepID=A0A256A9M5_9FLAO|nr:hypothetical protein CHX27_00875 [Flavobacterium aurantiibacter]
MVDPDGREATGDFYTKTGKYLGSDGINDNKVYVADRRNSDGTFANSKEIKGTTHTDFATAANVVKHESSGNKSESLWIAHTANNAKDNNAIDYKRKNSTLTQQLTDSQYSTTPSSARSPLSTQDASMGAENARAAVIDVLMGGIDPTGGAVLWDGTDFLTRGTSHNKFKEFQCIDIDAKSMSNFSSANQRYKVHPTFNDAISLDASYSASGRSGRPYSVQSTGAQGRSIFWKIIK